MEFINRGEPVQVQQSDGPGRYRFELVRTGETIDVTEDVGTRLGFEKVKPKTTEGKIGKVKVETKQIEKPVEYESIIEKIKGIGRKTAKDIIRVFPTIKKLQRAISREEVLPFRDDVEKKLKKKFGGTNARKN